MSYLKLSWDEYGAMDASKYATPPCASMCIEICYLISSMFTSNASALSSCVLFSLRESSLRCRFLNIPARPSSTHSDSLSLSSGLLSLSHMLGWSRLPIPSFEPKFCSYILLALFHANQM